MVGEVETGSDQYQARGPVRSLDLTRREFELLHPACRERRQGALEREDYLPARLGLRDGPRGSLGGRLRAQAAVEDRPGARPAGSTSTPTWGSGYRMDAGALVQEDPGVSESPAGAPSDAPQVPEVDALPPAFTGSSQVRYTPVTAAPGGALPACPPEGDL